MHAALQPSVVLQFSQASLHLPSCQEPPKGVLGGCDGIENKTKQTIFPVVRFFLLIQRLVKASKNPSGPFWKDGRKMFASCSHQQYHANQSPLAWTDRGVEWSGESSKRRNGPTQPHVVQTTTSLGWVLTGIACLLSATL